MGLLPPSLMGEGHLIAAYTPSIDLPENPCHLTRFCLKPSRLDRLKDTGTRDAKDLSRLSDCIGSLVLSHRLDDSLSC